MRHAGFVESVHLALLGVADVDAAMTWSPVKRRAAMNVALVWNGVAEINPRTMKVKMKQPAKGPRASGNFP